MRSLKDLLEHFKKHSEHSQDAALNALYELGRADAKAEFQAGLAGPTPPAQPEGQTNDEEKVEQEHAQDPQAQAGQADSEQEG